MSARQTHAERVRKSTRGQIVTGVYRWIVGLAFLFAAFTTWPEAKWAIGLGFLAFQSAVSAVAQALTGTMFAQNQIDDEAERKTRQAILLAHERPDLVSDQYDFWHLVDQRVSSEMGDAEATTWWKGFALAVGSLLYSLTWDLLGLAIVAGMTRGA